MDAAEKTLTSRRRWRAAAIVCFITIAAVHGDAALATSEPARVQTAAPKRVISLVPAVTEMLYAVGAGSQVIAVSSYDHFPKEVEPLPRVGALIDPDIEKILSLRPDLVIVYGTQDELKVRLTRASIPMFLYQHAGLADITATIRSVGVRVGHAPEAEKVAGDMERGLDDIRTRVAGLPRYKTLLVFGREPGRLTSVYASAGVGFFHDLLEVIGSTDVFADVKKQNVQISSEQILARAPEAIIEFHGRSTPAQLETERKVWGTLSSLPAVKNNRVFLIADERLNIPGPRIVEAARLMADALHPIGSGK